MICANCLLWKGLAYVLTIKREAIAYGRFKSPGP
jgi:hypothetical protein